MPDIHEEPGPYPGLGLSLRMASGAHSETGHYALGIHPRCRGSNSDLLQVREVAMMRIMDMLTDKPDWHVKVFDDAIVSKWCQEALEYPKEELWHIATGDKMSRQTPAMFRFAIPEDILNQPAIEYVSTHR